MTRVKAAVVGGLNMDVCAQSAGALMAGDSNPGAVSVSPGGVGRNIARQLARLGAEAFLFTAVADDDIGRMLKTACARDGISLKHAVTAPGRSGMYVSLHDNGGDMAAAVNDMQIIDAVTPEYLAGALGFIRQMDVLVLDANLPEASIRFLAQNAGIPIVADPVSCHKAARLAGALPFIDALKPNLMEAEHMTGARGEAACAAALLKAGVKRVILSLGERGVYFADESAAGRIPCARIVSCQTTGAGDALCAGIALSVIRGENAEMCARAGMRACADFLYNREEARIHG